jgi:uncharacterized repeat protein (TIGR01451 family)
VSALFNKVVRELNAPASFRPNFYRRFVAPLKQGVWTLPVLGTLLTANPALAQLVPVNPIETRYGRGDIRTIGNTLMSCAPVPTCPQAGTSNANNNQVTMVYVDTDSDNTTFNSSNGQLNLPAGATVVWAGLYWSGRISAVSQNDPDPSIAARFDPQASTRRAARNQAQFRVGAGAYQAITASSVQEFGERNEYYQAFADVTTQVRTNGSNTYWVGNVQATPDLNNVQAGWSLVVVYRNESDPFRNLTVYAGVTEVATPTEGVQVSIPVAVQDFRTPASGRYTVKLGMVSYDGDGGDRTGDSIALNGTQLETATNPGNNFFNGTINSFSDSRNPQLVNQLGNDIVEVSNNNLQGGAQLDTIIGNNATSATFTFRTSSTREAYYPGVFTLAIDSPQIRVTKQGPATITAGSDLTYTISIENTSGVNASQIELGDTITPPGLTVSSISAPECQNRFPCTLTEPLPGRQTRQLTATFQVPANFNANQITNIANGLTTEDPTTRTSNEVITTVTAAQTGTIGDTVYNDTNGNGVRDEGEPGIAGIVVRLTRPDGTTIDSPPTGPDGRYQFTNLPFGDYRVSVTNPPQGLNPTQTQTNPITVNAQNANIPTADFGFTPQPAQTGTIGDTVYNDTNGNGVRDEGEPGIAGIVVRLTRPDGTTVDSPPTGPDGRYQFTNLPFGDYRVSVTNPPQGLNPTQTQPNVIPVNAQNANVPTADFGFNAPANRPPVANDNSTSTDPGVPINIPVLGNDSDEDNNLNPGSVTIITNPGRGTVTPNPDGTITYTPNPDFTSGTDTFEYQVCDTTGLCDRATVSVTIPANAFLPPVAEDRATPPFPNTNPITVPALRGTDPDGQVVTYTITTLPTPQQGTLLLNGQPVQQGQNLTPEQVGQLVFQPNPNFTGTVTFNYRVTDNQGLTSPPATVTIPVIASPRVQIGDTVFNDVNGDRIQNPGEPGLPNVTVTLNLFGPDGIFGTADDSTQTTTTNSNGNYSFPNLPPGNYRVTITPPSGFSPTTPASQTISVTSNNPTVDFGLRQNQPQNQPPVANNDVAGANPGQPVNINPLINDRSPDGTPLNPGSLRIVSNPTNGTVQVNPDGTITYTPNPGFTSGTDTFVYEICDNRGICDTATITVTVPAPTQQPPVVNDDRASTNPNTPVVINVLDNDTDPNNNLNPTNVTIVTPPTNGTVSVNPVTGQITYTPNPGFNSGTDTFEYQVCDTTGQCDRATVTVSIPVTATNPPVANNDSTSTNPNTPVLINILNNDSDPDNNLDPRTVRIISNPSNGTVRVNPDGTVTYTPNPGFTNGTDIFTYQVCDSTGLCDTATVTVTVPAQVPRPPVATNDSTSTNPGTPVLINVAGNDRDPDGNLDPTTVQIINPPQNGTVRIDPGTGNIIYQPNPGFSNGTDTFTYRICDTTGLCSEATVTVTVPVTTNPPPVANPDAIATNPNTPVTINVLGNDSGNLNPSTLRIVTPPANGRVVINPDGTVTFIPNPGFTNGTDSFTYQICDTAGNCTEGRVTVRIPQPSPNQAEVQVNLTGPTTPIAAGTNVTFNTQVTNNGPGIAQGVIATFPLPTGVTFVSATPSQGTCVESNGVVTCNLGNMNPGQTVAIPIVVRPTQPETINLTTTVVAQNEAIVNNNTATAAAVAIAGTPRVILVKRITAVTSNGTTTNFSNFVDDPSTQNDNASGWSSLRPVGEIQPSAPVRSGDIVEYTVYFLSEGSVPAQNVNFCDAIPNDTTFIADGFGSRTGIQLNQGGSTSFLTNAQDGDVGAFFSPLSPLPSGNACGEQNNRNGSVILNLREIPNTPNGNVGFVRFRVIID